MVSVHRGRGTLKEQGTEGRLGLRLLLTRGKSVWVLRRVSSHRRTAMGGTWGQPSEVPFASNYGGLWALGPQVLASPHSPTLFYSRPQSFQLSPVLFFISLCLAGRTSPGSVKGSSSPAAPSFLRDMSTQHSPGCVISCLGREDGGHQSFLGRSANPPRATEPSAEEKGRERRGL